VSIATGNRKHAQEAHTDSTGGGALDRRAVLGGLAAVPVLTGLAVSATPASAARAALEGNAPTTATDALMRGDERRYNAPLLTAGTRLLLPKGVKAVPVLDHYRRPHLASAASAWPYLKAADGTTVDASVVPERGAPTRVAILTGFTEGWYELLHANGRADRVTWDAKRLPVLWLYGEFGATDVRPYRDRFYALALQPMSRNPYSRNISTL
jgi:hypothetical protein